MSVPPAVETTSLRYAVRDRALLDDISLRVGRGELVALVGPNGSGKTTLLRCLAGILRPAAGEVRIAGAAVADLSRKEVARRVAYLPQDTTTHFEISVADAVALGRYPHLTPWRALGRGDWDLIEAALARLDLGGLRDRLVPTLSGGERQRVFLARALAQEADVLLFDEPTTALDVGHQLELMDLLAALHDEGRTIIVAMHDLHLVWERMQRAVLLDGGRLRADAPCRDLLRGEAAETAFGVRVESSGDMLRFRGLPKQSRRD